jgi:hypothetical protein
MNEGAYVLGTSPSIGGNSLRSAHQVCFSATLALDILDRRCRKGM